MLLTSGSCKYQHVSGSKHTHRICEINKQHKTVMVMLSQNPALKSIQVNDNLRKVESQQGSYLYSIQQNKHDCDCKLSCRICNVCIHMYTCSCMDATIHATICKHVHFLHMHKLARKGNSKPTAPSASKGMNDCDYFTRML